jgi:hypothetical protein
MSGSVRNLTRKDFESFWYRDDIPLAKIAAALDLHRAALTEKGRRLGLPLRRRGAKPRACPDEFKRMWEFGVSASNMARYFGYSDSASVRNRRRALGLSPRSPCGSRSISVESFLEAELGRKMLGATQ